MLKFGILALNSFCSPHFCSMEATNIALVAEVRLLKQLVFQKDAQLEALASSAAEKRKCVVCSCILSPLEDEGILHRVFSFVGDADYILVACVCRKWRGRYITLCYDAALIHESERLRTGFKSVLATAERLEWALSSGLTVGFLLARSRPERRFAKLIVKYTARLNKLELLQWLREQGCPWELKTLLNEAAKGAGVPLLEWLRQHAPDQFSAAKATMLYYAGFAGNLEAASWLLQAGAPWPDSYVRDGSPAALRGTCQKICWPVRALQWALSTVRTWGDWHCNQLALKRYRAGGDRRTAKKLFKWAHANGCPCTCEADAAAAVAAAARGRDMFAVNPYGFVFVDHDRSSSSSGSSSCSSR
eukprot:13462-Heterococcus_DN1.PRE.2